LVDLNPRVGFIIFLLVLKSTHFLAYSTTAAPWQVMIDENLHRILH
jgi:hypothetical protein